MIGDIVLLVCCHPNYCPLAISPCTIFLPSGILQRRLSQFRTMRTRDKDTHCGDHNPSRSADIQVRAHQQKFKIRIHARHVLGQNQGIEREHQHNVKCRRATRTDQLWIGLTARRQVRVENVISLRVLNLGYEIENLPVMQISRDHTRMMHPRVHLRLASQERN